MSFLLGILFHVVLANAYINSKLPYSSLSLHPQPLLGRNNFYSHALSLGENKNNDDTQKPWDNIGLLRNVNVKKGKYFTSELKMKSWKDVQWLKEHDHRRIHRLD